MKLLNFTIINLTICLILGIVMGYFINITVTISLVTSALFLLLLAISYVYFKNKLNSLIWFGVLAYLTIISIGVLTVNFHNQKNHINHYTKTISYGENNIKTISFRVKEILKPGNYYNKYVVDILKIDSTKVSGKTLLNIEKDSTEIRLNVDEIAITKAQLKDLIHPLNPHQFDYKNYLSKQYIYHQIFTTNNAVLKLDSKSKSILGFANTIRTFINAKLKDYHFSKDELSIVNALLLGQRQDISKNIYTSYTNAGAIHILAVSGLHVGIILFILNIVFKPIEQFKNGKVFKTILIVCFLWAFAVISGLSASVTRAVTMFSILAIAMNLKRPTNIYNTLAISMFFILLVKPMFLFDVGFQLSYLAVFSIVTIDPILYKLWQPKNKFLDKYWHTFTVTVSAQFGIIPISLYYFHQFPGLFFISNLVIIPFLGLILGLGVLVIVLACINALPQFLATSFGYIINLMNDFVGWVSQQEDFLFKAIPFSFIYVITSYFLITAFVRCCIKKTYWNIRLFLISVLIFQLAFFYTDLTKPSNEFIVFHKSRFSLIGNTSNNNITIASDLDSLEHSKTKIIKDYRIGNHINQEKHQALQTYYQLNNTSILVVDSLGIYNFKSVKPDYVLLRQSPKINLNRLIDSINPKQIIADGSNYKSYIEHWETVCLKRKIPFHQTSKKGAFILNY
ncbi:competence protein [Tamlana sedimentorum]|uniref:Competence protein n=1 Tax=Neotamlana sedimentorum TaxID=1435349 RepID=A0A0D7WB95_9FLAO|nr:ComEC/Rec2 family competence protein [Tamlana sedimentorum]KJD36334.1 competence protein [Tamlana sedimentorum]